MKYKYPSYHFLKKVYKKICLQKRENSLIRNEDMVQSAYYTPLATFEDMEFYPTILDKACRLGYGLTMNHGFVDGNKRMGAVMMLAVLRRNGYEVIITNDELTDLFYGISEGKYSYENMRNLIASRVKERHNLSPTH